MEENYYSWDPNTYIIDEKIEKLMNNSTCEWNKMNEICERQLGERITKKDDHVNNGNYYVYGGGDMSDTFKVDKFNRENFTCKISRFAASKHNCVMIINDKYWLNDSGFTIISKN